MNRPAHIWIAFALCLAVVLGAMGWISVTVLRLERAESNAQRQAEREENMRLALWRMDSALAPLVAAENGRPYFVYRSFYPLDRTFGNMFNNNAGGDLLMPSPLLTQPSPFVLLHFQIDPDGTVGSPQIPGKQPAGLAEQLAVLHDNIDTSSARMKELSAFIKKDDLLSVLPQEELSQAVPIRLPANKIAQKDGYGNGTNQNDDNNKTKTEENDKPVNPTKPAGQTAAQTELASNDNAQQAENRGQQGITWAVQKQQEQGRRSSAERNYRVKNFEDFSQQEKESQKLQVTQLLNEVQCATNGLPQQGMNKQQPGKPYDRQNPLLFGPQQPGNLNLINPNFLNMPDVFSHVAEGATVPVWLGNNLVLARRCSVRNQLYIQGCWLDWPSIQSWLLGEISDLLPAARLEAVHAAADDKQAYMLAALPVRLVPGAIALESPVDWSPMRLSLLIAWVCVILAAGAVAALLLGAVSLSERRGAFVSSVTHELRTPLTTFRMYTEMLAGNMVPEEAQRQKYLNTLRVEAERLSHLVENVLAYARLERGRPGSRLEPVPLSTLLDKACTRLAERAAQAGMTLRVDALTPGLAAHTVRTDPSAVEQIVFNLVDNACKYAIGAKTPEIHVQLSNGTSVVELRVRDHGPGLTQKDARNLFQPFSKTAREAAHSAPGVGLGLALSRRLAREMGGDLKLDPSVTDGACFVLTMPLVQS